MTTKAKGTSAAKKSTPALPTKKQIPAELIAQASNLLAFSEGDAKKHTKELNAKKWYSIEAFLYEATKLGIKNPKSLKKALAKNPEFDRYWDAKPEVSAQADAPAKDTGKASSTTKSNLDKAAKEITSERTTNYKYAAGMDNQAKKEFRRKARATKERMEKQIAELSALTDKESKRKLSDLKSEFEIFNKETYTS